MFQHPNPHLHLQFARDHQDRLRREAANARARRDRRLARRLQRPR